MHVCNASVAKIIFILGMLWGCEAFAGGSFYLAYRQEKPYVSGISVYEPVLWPAAYTAWVGLDSLGVLSVENGIRIVEPVPITLSFGTDVFQSAKTNNYLDLKMSFRIWE
jgi:hypothetical protein